MNYRNRAMMALALAAGFLSLPARAAEIDRYLPAHADMVMSVNVRQVVDSPVFKEHFHELARKWVKTAPAGQVMTLLDLDPLKDVQRITAAGTGVIGLLDRGLVIAHGDFDV